MVVDEQLLIFNGLKEKSKYLKECLWQGNFNKPFRRKKESSRGTRFLE